MKRDILARHRNGTAAVSSDQLVFAAPGEWRRAPGTNTKIHLQPDAQVETGDDPPSQMYRFRKVNIKNRFQWLLPWSLGDGRVSRLDALRHNEAVSL